MAFEIVALGMMKEASFFVDAPYCAHFTRLARTEWHFFWQSKDLILVNSLAMLLVNSTNPRCNQAPAARLPLSAKRTLSLLFAPLINAGITRL